MKYASTGSAEKIDISTITLNGGTILTQATLFSIEGTVTNLFINTILFDVSTEIGQSIALNQIGEVTQLIKVDDVKIQGQTLFTNIQVATALFKFDGVC